MSGNKELTEQAVMEALERDKPASLAGLARGLGYSGSVSSWLRNRLLELVPDLGDRISRNKGSKQAGSTATNARPNKPAKKAPKAAPKKSGKTYPRDQHNPFREGSAYAAGYDILASAGDKGVERSELVSEMARVTGKPVRKAYFDATVVLSSRPGPEHGGDGGSHRCIAKAADAYWVEKRNGHVTIRLRDRRY